MPDAVATLGGSEVRETRTEEGPERVDRSTAGLADDGFEFGEAQLDGVEVGAVGCGRVRRPCIRTPWRSAPYFTRGGMSRGQSAPGKHRAVDVRPLDRRAIPTAHPAVPIAEVVLRATAGTRLVVRRRGRAARAEPSGPVLLPPESAAPVEAPGAVEAAVIGRDVAGGRAVLVLAAWTGRLRRRRAP